MSSRNINRVNYADLEDENFSDEDVYDKNLDAGADDDEYNTPSSKKKGVKKSATDSKNARPSNQLNH